MITGGSADASTVSGISSSVRNRCLRRGCPQRAKLGTTLAKPSYFVLLFKGFVMDTAAQERSQPTNHSAPFDVWLDFDAEFDCSDVDGTRFVIFVTEVWMIVKACCIAFPVEDV